MQQHHVSSSALLIFASSLRGFAAKNRRRVEEITGHDECDSKAPTEAGKIVHEVIGLCVGRKQEGKEMLLIRWDHSIG